MSRTTKGAILGFVCAFILLWAGCDVGYKDVTICNAGITVHGYCKKGWIRNDNDFPVRIKQVWIFKGETTQWIKIFQPGEIYHQYISHQHGWHVYTIDGVEIGWIRVTA